MHYHRFFTSLLYSLLIKIEKINCLNILESISEEEKMPPPNPYVILSADNIQNIHLVGWIAS
jgi:hypothetical protein